MGSLALPFTFAPSPPEAMPQPASQEPHDISAEDADGAAESQDLDGPKQADKAGVRSVIEQLKAGAGRDGNAVEPETGELASPDANGEGLPQLCRTLLSPRSF